MSNQTVAKAPKKHNPTQPTGNRSFIESSWCAETLFLWLSPLIQTGYERTLYPEDLPDVRKVDCAATNHTYLSEIWEKEQRDAERENRKPSLLGSVFTFVFWRFVQVFSWKMGWLSFAILGNAFLLRWVIQYVEGSGDGIDTSLSTGLLLVCGFLVSETGRSYFVNRHWFVATLTGIRLRAAFRAMLYSKALKLRAVRFSAAKLVNLASTDLQRLLEACTYGEFLISGPVAIVVIMALQWWILGPAVLVGFAVMIVLVLVQAYLGRLFAGVRRQAVRLTDQRVRLMTEVLRGIRLVKQMAWEAPFAARVAHIRGEEVAHLRTAAWIRACSSGLGFTSSLIVGLVTFLFHSLVLGEPLRADAAWSVLALFNVLRFPVTVGPLGLRFVSEAIVGVERAQAFLLLPEASRGDMPDRLEDEPTNSPSANKPSHSGSASSSTAVALADAPGSTDADDEAVAELNGDGSHPTNGRFAAPSAGDKSASAADADADAEARPVAVRLHGATFAWYRQEDRDREQALAQVLQRRGAPSPGPNAGRGGGKAAGGQSKQTTKGGDSTEAPDKTASGKVIQPVDKSGTGAGGGFHLRDVSLEVPKGSVVGIAGPVGSGKSSLLGALLGRMVKLGGSSGLRGSVSYVAQEAWIFNASVRDNILFGSYFDEKRYREVVRACALESDLAMFPNGDQTELGARGFNASGGQKARITLARAVYANADVVLLDDPLSAVDTHVGRHLWEQCIDGMLRQQGKTVLLVTHQVQWLPQCDQVVILAQGEVQHTGSFAQLCDAGVDMGMYGCSVSPSPSPSPPASEAYTNGPNEASGKQDGEDDAQSSAAGNQQANVGAAASQATAAASDVDVGIQEASKIAGQGGSAQPSSNGGASAAGSSQSDVLQAAAAPSADEKPAATGKPASGTLTSEEDRKEGSVSCSTVGKYFAAGGSCWLGVLILVLLLASRSSRVVADFSVSEWVDASAAAAKDGLPANVTTRAGLAEDDLIRFTTTYVIASSAVFALSLLFGATFALVSLEASRNVHDEVFASIIQATRSFFDRTPLGRIINRFTSDYDLVDQTLPTVLQTTLETVSLVGLSIVSVAVFLPWFLVGALPIAYLFYAILQYFRRSVRALKRLDGVSRSPIVSLLQTSLEGISTLRAFGAGDAYFERFLALSDANDRAYTSFYGCNRWVGIRLDTVTTLIVFSTALVAVLSRGTESGGIAGLALVFALQTAGVFQFATRQASEAEALFTSVERLLFYIGRVPREQLTAGPEAEDRAIGAAAEHEGSEGAAGSREQQGERGGWAARVGVPTSLLRLAPGWDRSRWPSELRRWPFRGHVELSGLSARYREGLPLVLKDVSIKVPAGSRVGIVGRTGSGKSTLMLAMFRMIDFAGGCIKIDGVDVAGVPLGKLRSSMSLVPQDPVLFSGTVRYNLAPFGEYSDEQLWEALDRVGLGDAVRRQGGGGGGGGGGGVTRSGVTSAVGVASGSGAGRGGLDAEVEDGGGNWSAGERQLLCLARAILRKSRVCVMDEATSSVSPAEDAVIQRAIRSDLKGSTMLIVAHRLGTVMDSDYILAMKDGEVAEFGHPAELLGLAGEHGKVDSGADGDGNMGGGRGVTSGCAPGLLASLVDQTGEATARQLRAQALEAYRAKQEQHYAGE